MRASAGVGWSKQPEAFAAGAAAAQMALSEEGSKPALVIAYSTVMYEQSEVLRGIRSVFGEAPIVGGSTQGISRLGAVDEVDRVVGVGVLFSEQLKAHVACESGLSTDSFGVGQRLGEGLDPSNPNPLLLWYEPLTGADVDALLEGLAEAGFPQVIGGATGQPFGPTHKTYQYHGDDALHDSAVVVQLEGCDVLFDLTHGTEPLGYEMTVTDAEGIAIKAIDGEPALDVWIEQFGGDLQSDVNNFASWALGIHLPDEAAAHYEGPITRAVFALNEEKRELVFQSRIPKGAQIQLCHRTEQAVYDRAVAMAQRFGERLAERSPFFALSFECAARPQPFLGDQLATQEVCEMQKYIGPELPWLGFYAWGEVAPVGSRSYFHNYTFPLCVFCEPQ